jgi:hypothetical protein
MKLYRDQDNNIYAYEDDGSQDHLIGDKIAITQTEADAINRDQETARLASLDWAEQRRLSYPTIGEQLDALYHAGVFPEHMAERIRAVKQQYPKP